MEERLQKILSRAGYGSRRACEEIVMAGRVRVGEQVAKIGSKADVSKDKITVDGRAISAPIDYIYVALHKPRKVLSTVKAEPNDNRKTVSDLVDVPERLYPVGRLDYDSEGLVLMTNDGDLANYLTHPKYGHTKEYKVLLARRPDDKQLQTWSRGVVLEDGHKTAPAQVRFESTAGKGAWIRVVMGEGRKRQIREVGFLLGLPVVRILRIRIATLELGRLKPRQWRYLTASEVTELRNSTRKNKR